MKKLLFCFLAWFLIISSVSGQSIFKINQYNVYYNKAIALRNLGRIKEADDCLKIVNFPRGAQKI